MSLERNYGSNMVSNVREYYENESKYDLKWKYIVKVTKIAINTTQIDRVEALHQTTQSQRIRYERT